MDVSKIQGPRIGVLQLGPMWVEELKSEIQRRRNDFAETASRCKPDGDFRKQMEMVLSELDVMIAAPDLLAACKLQHAAIDALMAMLIDLGTGFMPSKSHAWPAVLAGSAAIAKATGSAA